MRRRQLGTCACPCHNSGYGGTLGPCWGCRASHGRPNCDNCGEPLTDHCKRHLIPCCPGKCGALIDWSDRAQ